MTSTVPLQTARRELKIVDIPYEDTITSTRDHQLPDKYNVKRPAPRINSGRRSLFLQSTFIFIKYITIIRGVDGLSSGVFLASLHA